MGMRPGEKEDERSLRARLPHRGTTTHGAAGGESVPPPLPPLLDSAGLRGVYAFSTTSIPTCRTRPAASLGAPTGVVLLEHRETERTSNTAGSFWVPQPDSRPGGRTALSGAPHTSLRRTAGRPPRQHERRTRFPPDRHSNSSVVFLRCLCPRHPARHPAHDPAPSVIIVPPAFRSLDSPWQQDEARQSVALAPMRDAPRAVTGAFRTSAARPVLRSRS
jgi:hypothetical protein